MRYHVKVMPYVGKNKAQKSLSDYVTNFHNILLDTDKEQAAFIKHLKEKIKEIGEENPRCKAMEMRTWRRSKTIGGCSIEFVFEIHFNPINETHFPEFQAKDTYKRVHYLHRKAKEAGYRVELDNNSKTIWAPQNLFARVNENKYLRELQFVHNYGVQMEMNH